MTPSARLVFCTCPDEASADRLAETLVGEHLAACVTRIPGAQSTYFWQGQIQRDAEVLLLIKTTEDRYPALEAHIQALHPYEVPEILAVPILRGLPAYLQWLEKQCT